MLRFCKAMCLRKGLFLFALAALGGGLTSPSILLSPAAAAVVKDMCGVLVPGVEDKEKCMAFQDEQTGKQYQLKNPGTFKAGDFVCVSGTLPSTTIVDTCMQGEHFNNTTISPWTCVPPPNTTMVAWYPFDETAGSTAANLATGNTGTLYGSPTPVPGRVKRALYFDGVNDYVDAPSTMATNFGPANLPTDCANDLGGLYSSCLGDFSIDAWVKIPANASQGVMVIVDKRSESPLRGYSFFVYQGQLGLQLADGIGTQYSNFLSGPLPFFLYSDQWQHIAVTVDRFSPTGIRWYQNGFNVGNPGNPMGRSGSLVNASPVRIGTRTAASPLTGWFKGAIDELEIFNRVLSDGEVGSLFHAGPFGKCKQ